jgi:hypothetical protein
MIYDEDDDELFNNPFFHQTNIRWNNLPPSYPVAPPNTPNQQPPLPPNKGGKITEDKEIYIYEYSNPKTVLKKAKKLLNNDSIILSTHKNKKYAILNPETGQWIHFGQFGFQDYTKHKDEKRKLAFQRRNAKWKNMETYTPGFLSYHILWS